MTKAEKIDKIIEILKRISEKAEPDGKLSGAALNQIISDSSPAPEISIQDKVRMTAIHQ